MMADVSGYPRISFGVASFRPGVAHMAPQHTLGDVLRASARYANTRYKYVTNPSLRRLFGNRGRYERYNIYSECMLRSSLSRFEVLRCQFHAAMQWRRVVGCSCTYNALCNDE